MGRGKAVAERTTGSGKARSSRTSNLEDLKPRGPRTSCCIWFVRLGVIGRLSDWAFVRLGVIGRLSDLGFRLGVCPIRFVHFVEGLSIWVR